MTDRIFHSSRHPRSTVTLARLLGWFSIGLGLAELTAPRQVGRPIGMGDRTTLLRLYGLREIAQGVGILLSRDPKPWVWARVAGDALDVGTLVSGSRGARPRNMVAAMGTLAAVALVDFYCARRLSPMPVREPKRLADYRTRSGFPRSPDEMRGAASNRGTGVNQTGDRRSSAAQPGPR